MDVNYFGAVNATRAVIRGMKARQEGRVVFFSSQAGQLGVFGYSGYSASKFALRGMAEALQMEVSSSLMKINETQLPGATNLTSIWYDIGVFTAFVHPCKVNPSW